MKKLTLISCIAVGLISSVAIAETLTGAAAGAVGKTVGGAVGAGVGAGAGAAKGAITAPVKGVASGLKCLDKTGMPVLCTAAGAINTGASPVQGTVEGTVEGAVKGSGN